MALFSPDATQWNIPLRNVPLRNIPLRALFSPDATRWSVRLWLIDRSRCLFPHDATLLCVSRGRR